MKKHLKGFIAGVIVTVLVFSGVMTAFAALPEIIWNNVSIATGRYKIYIDGELFEATDKNGVIEVFNYNGWLWAPFEHIARALGQNARWDGDTRSLFLTTPEVPPPPKPKVTYFFDVLTAYEQNNRWSTYENQSFKMLGDEYTNGWEFRCSDYNSSVEAYFLYNLRGQYKTIKGILGHIDGSSRDHTGTISIYLDDKLYKEYPVTSTMLPMEVTVDVTDANIMKVTFKSNNTATHSSTSCYGFGNVTVE